MKYTLPVTERQMQGRKVQRLRNDKSIPATIYGKNLQSLTIACDRDAFLGVFREAGETGVIELTLGSGVHPVLIHSVQRHPVSRDIIHIEFKQVDLKVITKANIPIELIGEAEALTAKTGLMLQELSEIEVEALPTDLPEKIELDVTKLAAVDDVLFVKDLKIPANVTVTTDPEMPVVRIAALPVEEVQEPTAESAEVPEAAQAEESSGDTAEATKDSDE